MAKGIRRVKRVMEVFVDGKLLVIVMLEQHHENDDMLRATVAPNIDEDTGELASVMANCIDLAIPHVFRKRRLHAVLWCVFDGLVLCRCLHDAAGNLRYDLDGSYAADGHTFHRRCSSGSPITASLQDLEGGKVIPW